MTIDPQHELESDKGSNLEQDSELGRRLVRALEAAPAIRIPQGFASRVAAHMPAPALAARDSVPVSPSVGRRVAWGAAALLLVAILALAPSVAGVHINLWIEIGLEIEFAALTAWLALRPQWQR